MCEPTRPSCTSRIEPARVPLGSLRLPARAAKVSRRCLVVAVPIAQVQVVARSDARCVRRVAHQRMTRQRGSSSRCAVTFRGLRHVAPAPIRKLPAETRHLLAETIGNPGRSPRHKATLAFHEGDKSREFQSRRARCTAQGARDGALRDRREPRKISTPQQGRVRQGFHLTLGHKVRYTRNQQTKNEF